MSHRFHHKQLLGLGYKGAFGCQHERPVKLSGGCARSWASPALQQGHGGRAKGLAFSGENKKGGGGPECVRRVDGWGMYGERGLIRGLDLLVPSVTEARVLCSQARF